MSEPAELVSLDMFNEVMEERDDARARLALYDAVVEAARKLAGHPAWHETITREHCACNQCELWRAIAALDAAEKKG